MNKGTVYLVGAGPGDPRLITLRALECIRGAEVLVYDRLVNPGILDFASDGAEKIFVGKRSGMHALPQEKINLLLAEKALENKIVVRLKGGDPFVFGRGGEEAELLVEKGVPFEIVPGITSAVAVPAYAGIPVTHRDFVSAFSVITGHEEEKESSALDWDKLAKSEDTLIFLMGMKNLSLNVQSLLARGKPPETPVALIRWGTLAKQEVLQGTLENIVSLVEESGFKPPAVTIMGRVVGLRDKLKWWEKKPLMGRSVVITRPRHLQKSFREKILDLGGDPIYFPTVEVISPPDNVELDRCLEHISEYGWIIFTSIHGVQYFFQRMREKDIDFRDLKGVKLAAIGPKTREAVEALGIKVEFQPGEYRAEAIAQGMRGFLTPGEKILLPRADLARPELAEALKQMGMQITEVTAYCNILPRVEVDFPLEDLLNRREKPVITFTSSSTVTNFFRLLGEERGKLLADRALLASIGPITSETIRSYGKNVDIEASTYTMEGLLEAILKYMLEIS
ncbi:uroporphyrinogen-III C-methyltransferase [Candidatus Contubernalis alkaliaceticus]|uniref:uroporphyrinogen-III C-methyltransferase n=1 Tax=Candidatus Contubernalis alkaliaceticus TaxID=338645 RepID=UPI001F4BF5AA|nr:uroporphyrinogen-III C-methyltransferase [Candidatus Contubernalis alkalaceticus]UNC92950.1 uroporphyrinogen-III C-methyltransferase [Candidatus Contubernalis alkalaceticus]